MSIRLDPRRLQALKRLAGDAGTRPGDLVRQWVEERIDAERVGEGGLSLEARVSALEDRLAGLEGVSGAGATVPPVDTEPQAEPEPIPEPRVTGTGQVSDGGEAASGTEPAAAPEPTAEPTPEAAPKKGRRSASAAPAAKVALHDEMIAVLAERGPMTAGELATAISERGRYAPPRSGKPLDAAMVSQRASNPTYRSRFLRRDGRIGLAEAE
jgi:hypothetical protein